MALKIEMVTQGAVNQDSLESLNQVRVESAKSMQTILSLNDRKNNGQVSHNSKSRSQVDFPSSSSEDIAQRNRNSVPIQVQSAQTIQVQSPVKQKIPTLMNKIHKGQKVTLGTDGQIHSLKACFGWNTTNLQCDVDVSAFLLGGDGKVLGDAWFVFYGQTESPEESTRFCVESAQDRESIQINFQKLHPNVKKIVFVLTINEAFEKRLHFGMMSDAYIRILDERGEEIVSFLMSDYYSNVISMMIGEIYQYNGSWKFSAVGNGVAKDLAGLCQMYGVQLI
ncbi:MAG: TerD family protein [Lachnospiraceae bacterium]